MAVRIYFSWLCQLLAEKWKIGKCQVHLSLSFTKVEQATLGMELDYRNPPLPVPDFLCVSSSALWVQASDSQIENSRLPAIPAAKVIDPRLYQTVFNSAFN